MDAQEIRSTLIRLLKSYIGGELTGSQLESELTGLGEQGDETTDYIIMELCGRIDVWDNKPLHPTKSYCDYLQRLLLTLEAGASINVTREYTWTPRQYVAMAFLAVFIAIYLVVSLKTGFYNYPIVALPFGVVSLILLYWRLRDGRDLRKRKEFYGPYDSFKELSIIRRHSSFRKAKFGPQFYHNGRINKVVAFCFRLCVIVVILFRGPIALLIQSIPECQKRTSCKLHTT
ncbi:MAG: hypothetical protein ACYS32_01385 [Planctomycetota bacterium]|jgi:hypothetical protein